MDSQKVDLFITTQRKYFNTLDLLHIKEKLLALDNSKWDILSVINFKDPTLVLFISILIGSLGIDRFYIGDTMLGVLKLVTFGGCGVWTIVDWFLIMEATKKKNMEELQMLIG